MSLVFNDMVKVEDQRKVCKEYELTMDEDLQDKFEQWKIRDAEVERLMNSKKRPMGTVEYTEEEVNQMNLENGL
jgi:hypothetical protein